MAEVVAMKKYDNGGLIRLQPAILATARRPKLFEKLHSGVSVPAGRISPEIKNTTLCERMGVGGSHRGRCRDRTYHRLRQPEGYRCKMSISSPMLAWGNEITK
jgi:hypothetical protein